MAWVEKHGSGFRIRYRLDDGTLTSETGFTTKTTARDRADDIESDQRRGTFVDPRAGQIVLGEWVRQWIDAHDVGAGTWAKYDSHLRNHILPKFGDTAVAEITRMTVKAWVKSLRRKLAGPTVADVVCMLSMLLGEAVEEGLIGQNPCRKLRIERGETERLHATPAQVRDIAHRCSPAAALLVITAAYTGLRWGELAALQWPAVDLIEGTVSVDPDRGALHELGGKLTLGPPKTPASVRTVHLPAFLTDKLNAHHADNARERFVFTGEDGGLLRRSNFRRRIWLPAVGGHTKKGWASIHPGLHFHDLRHTHKTWMIEDQVAEVAQCKRLGHRLSGVRGIYSHVTPTMIEYLLSKLQHRWEQLLPADTPAAGEHLPNHECGHDQLLPICSQNAARPVDKDHRPAV